MLYVFHGTDTDALNQKLSAFLSALKKKRPDAEVFRIDDETFTADTLHELIESQGLFEQKYIVVLRGTLAAPEARDAVVKALKHMATAEHVFVLVEREIAASVLKKIEKHAEKVQRAGEAARKEADGFKLFALADALGERSRKKLWTRIIEARERGAAPEEVHGILFWQAKAIALAQREHSAEAAGMKAFPYKKAKEFSKNYSKAEADALLKDLVALYHDAHRGVHDFDTTLERFALSI